MSPIEGLMIFFSILAFYFLAVFSLHKLGILEKYNISLYGPALLFRTEKGVGFLKKIASKKRFWKAFGSSGVVVCFIVMILFVYLLVHQFYLLFAFPEIKQQLPGPEVALPIPGLNPIIPIEYIVYVILALAIAVVVHEFSHGILSLAGKIKVKSLGILLFVIPVGAFTEPDEEQLKKTDAAKRMRVFAAGPLSNFVVAFTVLFIFSFVFMSAVQPMAGADVLDAYDDTPAKEIGLSKGAVITSINNTEVKDINEFSVAMDYIQPNQTVNITYVLNGNTFIEQVKLTSVYEFYDQYADGELNESYKNMSFLGIQFNPYIDDYIASLKNPFTYTFPQGFLNVYILPLFGYIAGYNPIASPFTSSYEITGPLSVLPTDVFWMIALALYWIFWLNLAVGIFNVLPMIPLDGGFLFNDSVKSLIKRLKKDISDEKCEKIVVRVSTVVSLTILFLVIFPFIFKYI